jgi:hypothetical protein
MSFVVALIALSKTRNVMSLSANEPTQPCIFVLHENTPWVEPLRREFATIDAPFSEWFLDRGLVDLTSAPPKASSTIA